MNTYLGMSLGSAVGVYDGVAVDGVAVDGTTVGATLG